MKKFLSPTFLLIISCQLLVFDSFSQCGWTAKTNLGGAVRRNAVAFSIGTKGYIGTGFDGNSTTYYKDFWQWDQATNVWTQMADFGGTARYYAVGFSVGTKGYIGTGLDNTSVPLNDFWEWDQANNTWAQKANFGGGGIYLAVGFSVGTKGYIGTGTDNTTHKQDFWEYDPGNDTWAVKASFGGSGRRSAVGFSIGPKGYIGTGYDNANNKKDFWEWDQSADTWTQKADFGGTARVNAVGFSIGTRGYIGTGHDGSEKQDFWEWNQASNTWKQKANYGANRWNAVGFSIGTKGYIGTGSVGTTYYQDFKEYYTPVVDIASTQNVSCYLGNNGSASVTVTGSTPSYTYLWSNNQTTPSATGLSANNYSVTITDANSCTTSASLTITQPADLTTSVTQNNVGCNGGNNGTATVNPSGGTAAYTYSWNTSPEKTTQTITGLSANNYSVLVTDANNCTATATVAITEPAVLTVTVTQTNISCNGGSDGSATAGYAGGSVPYTYTWNTIPPKYTATVTGLTTGNYSVVVIDGRQCTASASVAITQPAPLTFTLTQTNVSCLGANNGSAGVAAVAGGSTPYTYSWNPGGATTSGISNLIAGNYTVNIADANNCIMGTSTVAVTQPSAVLTASITAQTNVTCNGGNNGSATVAASGGTSSYTYAWSPSGGSAAIASNISAGDYTVTVTDVNGCSATATVNVTEPGAINIPTTSQQSVTCNGGANGSASVSASGGTGTLSYLWSTGSTVNFIFNISANTYTVTVADAANCTATKTITIAQPPAIAIGISPVNAFCDNSGSASALTTGGTFPYAYSWNNGASTSATSGLAAGNYSLTITDANNCIATKAVSIGNSPKSAPTICLITVDSLSQNNLIVWDKTGYAHGDTFLIYRDTANNAYGLIGKVPYDSLSMFADTTRSLYAANGDPNVTSWRYKIAVADSCGNVSAKSLFHQSIYIQNNAGNFNWNHYQVEGQVTPVPALTNYLFQRDNLSNGNYATIQTLSASSTSYTDPAYATYQGTATWRVETQWLISCTVTVIKGPNPLATTVKSSKSNSSDKIQNPVSVAQGSEDVSLSIYPNPSKGQIKIQSTGIIQHLNVFNVYGENVLSKTLNSKEAMVNLDVPDGIYFLKAISQSGIIVKKLVVNH